MQQNLGFGLVWTCFGTDGKFRVHEFLVILITISSRLSKIGKNYVNIRNLSCLEFKFDDTRLSY